MSSGTLAAKGSDGNLVAGSQKGTNVQVAVRCRPLNNEEKKGNQSTIITCDTATKAVNVSYGPPGKKTNKTYNFDRVFGMYSTQEEVFDGIVRPIVEEVLAGFNCTIFAYGQTGTGKTHTMEGDIHSEENAGIVPRAVKAILEQLEAGGWDFTIRVSFLELYNEELQDLLNTSGEKKLKLCEDLNKGVVCQNLEEITVLNVGDIFEILQRGILQRQTAETLCNKSSSRSHSIFTMKIMIKECNVDGEEVVRHGQMNLVDLAGSECVGRSGAKNDRAREAGSINQSLLTLGRVITALVDHHGHIPYRDSKLTRLLQESLGGKAKTCIIATLSPAQLAMEETMSTLDYAHRAKNIKNQPTINQKMTKKVVLKEYCAEIESLKNMLQLTREKNGVYVDPNEFYAMEAKIATQESQLSECESALRSRNEEVKSLRLGFDQMTEKYEACQQEIIDGREKVESLTNALLLVQQELAHTKTELAAAETVVKVQSRTERMLHSQGKMLQDEVHVRREEIATLLGKVRRLHDNECDRIKKSARFVGDIDNNKSQLLDGISMIAFQSKTQSSVLCNGVSEMLTKGKATCTSLKGSIDGALSILINDAKLAKETMTDSCDKLTAHLIETNAHVAATLRSLQEELSNWLGDVDGGMKIAQQHLASQHTQLDNLSASIATQVMASSEASHNFIAQQQTDLTNAQIASSALRDELCGLFQSYHEEHTRELEEVKASIGQQAAVMEDHLRQMLHDMVTSASKAVDARVAHTAHFTSIAVDRTTDSVQQWDVSLAQAAEVAQRTTEAINKGVDDSSKEHVFMLAAASNSRKKTDDILSGISGDVGTKRSNLNETVTVLIKHVDKAMDEGCNTVTSTSDTANVILREVTSATETMTASAGKAMDMFVEFMDGKGRTVHEELGQHFVNLDSHFIAQKAGIAVVAKVTDMYGTEVANSATAITGTTPRKTIYAPLSDLVKTRDHEAIRSDVRAGKISYTEEEIVSADAYQAIDVNDIEGNGVVDRQEMGVDAVALGLALNNIEEPIVESKGDVVTTMIQDGTEMGLSSSEIEIKLTIDPEEGEMGTMGGSNHDMGVTQDMSNTMEPRSRSSTMSTVRSGKNSPELLGSMGTNTIESVGGTTTTTVRENAHPNNQKPTTKSQSSVSSGSSKGKLNKQTK